MLGDRDEVLFSGHRLSPKLVGSYNDDDILTIHLRSVNILLGSFFLVE